MEFLMAAKNVTETAAEFLINNQRHNNGTNLYEGVDLATLNTLEKYWVAWYEWWGNPVIATGVMSFLLHEIVYFGRCLPLVIIDQIPYFRKWKLQPTKIPTFAQQLHCTKLVLFSHFTVELPQIWLFHPMAESFGMATHSVPFPSWKTVLWQVIACAVFEDTWHYWAHRWFHTPTMYKRIHKIHHEYPAPFGLAAEYAHPLEVLSLGMGTILGPILLAMATHGDLHIFTVYVWIVVRLCQAVESHSGYDFPWGIRHIFPAWAGAEHHDYHHMAFTSNFSSSFRWWDHILGTDIKFKEYRTRIKSAKSKKEEDEFATAEGIKAANEVLRRANGRTVKQKSS